MSAVVCKCFLQIRAPNGRLSISKWNKQGTQNNQNRAKRESTSPKAHPGEQGPKSEEKEGHRRKTVVPFGIILDPKIIRIQPESYQQIDREKTLTIMPKGFQNGGKSNAKTHPKAMLLKRSKT